MAVPTQATVTPACESERPDAASAAAMAKTCLQRVEILAGRTEYTQVFANPDGTSTFTSSAVPARVRRPDGSWVAVDTTLRVRPDGWLEPAAVVADVAFSGGGPGPFAAYRDAGSLLTLALPMSLPTPRLEGSSAVYADVLPGVDLRVTASATSFRHVLVVKTAAAAASKELDNIRILVGGDVVVAPTGDGRVRFVDVDGRTVALTQTASMWDSSVRPGANGEVTPAATPVFLDGLRAQPPAELVSTERGPGETSRTAPVDVAAEAGGHALVLTPDVSLLRSPDAALPLYIDPSIGPTRSKWAYSRSKDSNYVMDGKAWIGKNPTCCGGDGTLFRAFFDFPTTSGSLTYKGKQIISASFSIELYHSFSCGNTTANIYRTGAITVSNGARMNWATRPLGSGAVFLGSASGHANKAGGCGPIQPDVLMTFGGNPTMRDDVQTAANGNWNTYTIGLCACDSNGANESTQDRWKKFWVDSRTVMSVTYNTVPGTPANLSPHQGQVACGGIVGSYSPALRAQYVDADTADTLSATFKWQQLPSGTVTSVAGPSKPANNYGSVTLNLGSGAEGKSYQFQVKTYDGHDYSPWSPWCTFIVDTTAPPPPVITPTASGTAPVYTACDPANIGACTPQGGPGIAGAFTFSEPPGPAGQDVVRYVYGWDSPSTTVTVSPGAATGPILLTPPHYGLNKLTAYSVDGTGHASSTTEFYILVSSPSPPLAYWPLDSIDAHNFTDQISGAALTTSGVTWSDDLRYIGAKAATFNGSGEANQLVPSFDTSGSFSVSAWVRLAVGTCTADENVVSIDADSVASNSHHSAFQLSHDCTNQRWRMRVAAQNVAAPNLAEAVSANASAVPGRWTFLVGVYDESLNRIQLWVDGTLVQTATPSSAWIASHGTGWKATGPVVLGRARSNDTNAGWLTGEIADVRVWNRVIVTDDVNGTNANPATGVPAQPALTTPLQVGWWQFPDGECFCGDTPDASLFSRKATLVPNWTLDPNWNGDPATTPAWLTADSHDSNGGLHLDGMSGHASTSDDMGTLDTGDDVTHPVLRTDQSFTVSAWARLDRTDTYQMVVTQDGAVGSGWYLNYAPETNASGGFGKWKFTMWPAAGSTDNTNATYAEGPAVNVTTSWHHVVGVLDAGHRQISLYVDGQVLMTSTLNVAWQPWQANGSLVIGRSVLNGSTVDPLAGTIDDVRVWQGTLNTQEIAYLYTHS